MHSVVAVRVEPLMILTIGLVNIAPLQMSSHLPSAKCASNGDNRIHALENQCRRCLSFRSSSVLAGRNVHTHNLCFRRK